MCIRDRGRMMRRFVLCQYFVAFSRLWFASDARRSFVLFCCIDLTRLCNLFTVLPHCTIMMRCGVVRPNYAMYSDVWQHFVYISCSVNTSVNSNMSTSNASCLTLYWWTVINFYNVLLLAYLQIDCQQHLLRDWNSVHIAYFSCIYVVQHFVCRYRD